MKKVKLICFTSLLLSSFISGGDNYLKEIVIDFISIEQKKSIRNGIHNVYVLNLYEYNSASDYCLSLGSIYNSFVLKEIEPTMYFKYQNEYVLIKTNNKQIDLKTINWKDMGLNGLKTIGEEDLILIKNKLLDNENEGFITGQKGLLLICKLDNLINLVIMKHEENASMLQSIYKDYSPEKYFNSIQLVDTIQIKGIK